MILFTFCQSRYVTLLDFKELEQIFDYARGGDSQLVSKNYMQRTQLSKEKCLIFTLFVKAQVIICIDSLRGMHIVAKKCV